MLQALREINTDDLPAHTPPELLPLVQARLLEQQPPADLRAQVDAALAGKRVRLAGVLRERAAPSSAAASATAEPGSDSAALDLPSLADLQHPHLLFERLLQERAADWPAEQLQDVRAAFAQLRDEAAQEQAARPAAAPAIPTSPRSAS